MCSKVSHTFHHRLSLLLATRLFILQRRSIVFGASWDWIWIVFWLIPWTPNCTLACSAPRCLYQSTRYTKNCKDSITIPEKKTLLYTITTKSLVRHLQFNRLAFVRMYMGSREIGYLALKKGTILCLDGRWHKRHPVSVVCELLILQKNTAIWLPECGCEVFGNMLRTAQEIELQRLYFFTEISSDQRTFAFSLLLRPYNIRCSLWEPYLNCFI